MPMQLLAKIIGVVIVFVFLVGIARCAYILNEPDRKWCEEKGYKHRSSRDFGTVCVDANGNIKVPPG
jgi:hypothetical protein